MTLFEILCLEENLFHSGDYPNLATCEIRNWTHNNDKKEWIGKYKTSYSNGILTYGISYNQNNSAIATYISELELDIIDYVTKEII